MIAIGVLGIGMAMSLALFPLGLRENQESARLNMGAVAVDNGMAISQLAIHQYGLGDSGSPTASMTNVLTPMIQSSLFHVGFDQCPMNTALDPNTRYGFVTLARNTAAESNVPMSSRTQLNQLVVVAYERMGVPTNIIACRNNSGTNYTFTVSTADYTNVAVASQSFSCGNIPFTLPPGSVIIDANTGVYAKVATFTYNAAGKAGTGTLDRKIRYSGVYTGDNDPNHYYYPYNANFYTVVETDGSGASSAISPIGVRAAKVYLAP